jgi:hypothetical protein
MKIIRNGEERFDEDEVQKIEEHSDAEKWAMLRKTIRDFETKQWLEKQKAEGVK